PRRILQYVRTRSRMAAQTPAAGRARTGQARCRADGFCLSPERVLWLQAGIQRRPLDTDRRGRPVPRSVLFAGFGFHRDREHLHHGADRARPARRTAGRACGDLPGPVFFVLPQHAFAVSRPVRAVRRCAGAAGEGDLGLRVLLGRAVPARDRQTPYRLEPAVRTAAAVGRRAGIEPDDAGLLPPLARGARAAEPTRLAGSARAALVRAVEFRVARPTGRRRSPRAPARKRRIAVRAGARRCSIGRTPEASAQAIPPFTPITCPLMYEAPSEHRNATALATSCGVPMRAAGIIRLICSVSNNSRVMLPSIRPGAITLTVTPRAAISRASDFAAPCNADLAAA